LENAAAGTVEEGVGKKTNWKSHEWLGEKLGKGTSAGDRACRSHAGGVKSSFWWEEWSTCEANKLVDQSKASTVKKIKE